MSIAERVRLEAVFLEAKPDLERALRRRVNSSDLVADLVQDVYLKCRVTQIDFRNRREARAYLMRMACNLAIDHHRVEGRRAAILSDLVPYFASFDKTTTSPEAIALATEKAKQIEDVLSGLPKLTRQIFILARLHGLTHKEVADRLGVSKSLVDKYLVQALLRCRDALGGLDNLD